MKKRMAFLCLTLTLAAFALFSAPSAYAAAPVFTDVPDSHWAVGFINEMAEGGLVAGYGGGKFGPEDPFNIDQMCTIICAAKGYPQSSKDGYWAYGAVDYCLNTLKCLPNYGAINKENYSVPVTRELAYYMLMTGLGKGPEAEGKANPQMTATDIPDYASIDVKFQPAILKAYQQGLTVGINDQLEFAPKTILSRAQGVTMLVRAGWTQAAEVAKPVTEGRTIDEIYAAFKASDKWEETQGALGMVLQYKDKTCGTIEIEVRETMSGKMLFVTMYERSPIGDGLIDNSAFKPAGRQVVKSVLDEIFPTKSQDAYMALKDVMLQTIYEYGGAQYPSAIRWYDGRMMVCRSNSDSHIIEFDIGELNDEKIYNSSKAIVRTSGKQKYISYAGGYGADPEAFELDKW
ncbi:S-layer homology domain-containing protein [Intestinimonas sp.]|uniref:S-layer homology domain-containing protein n=1 Tax=Intestinimonas sp. TaxID=1965293 RepID=UPI002618E260|nr:S-layer homology domain-containing protein [Intestinimonas sp.]